MFFLLFNPLRTVGHRPRHAKLQHKAPSKGVKKHCLLLSLGRDNRRQRVKFDPFVWPTARFVSYRDSVLKPPL
jgi:hypothetical protein